MSKRDLLRSEVKELDVTARPRRRKLAVDKLELLPHQAAATTVPQLLHDMSVSVHRGLATVRQTGGVPMTAVVDHVSAAYEPDPYEPQADETVQCPNCEAMNASDARYCDQCGFKLEGSDQVDAAGQVEPVATEPLTATEPTEDLGGKPSKGTPADKRLKANQKKDVSRTPNSAAQLLEPAASQAAADGDPAPPAVMQVAPMWRGPIVVEGETTGDGREFADGSITWADPPLPLRWQYEDSHGGTPTNKTVSVGTIQRVWRDGNMIMGEGIFDLGGPDDDLAHEAYRRNQDGALTGISIDADDITDADVEYIFKEPEGEEESEEDSLFLLLFAAPEKIVFHAGRIRAATLCDIPAFVEAKIEPIPEADRPAALVASALALAEEATERAAQPPALAASTWQDQAWRPPAEWFADPKLGQYVPIMVTEAGRVYGHAAAWGQCHLGYTDECVMPPFESDHSHFMTGELPLADGSRMAVGQITAGIEHAGLSLSASQAKDHYENTDACVADVVVGNDAHGIWVAGAIRPWAHASRVHALRASGQVSPDWRRIGGALRMVALLTVNTSGYQAPRSRALVAGGHIQSLISSGIAPVRPAAAGDDTSALELERRALLALRQKAYAKVHPQEGH